MSSLASIMNEIDVEPRGKTEQDGRKEEGLKNDSSIQDPLDPSDDNTQNASGSGYNKAEASVGSKRPLSQSPESAALDVQTLSANKRATIHTIGAADPTLQSHENERSTESGTGNPNDLAQADPLTSNTSELAAWDNLPRRFPGLDIEIPETRKKFAYVLRRHKPFSLGKRMKMKEAGSRKHHIADILEVITNQLGEAEKDPNKVFQLQALEKPAGCENDPWYSVDPGNDSQKKKQLCDRWRDDIMTFITDARRKAAYLTSREVHRIFAKTEYLVRCVNTGGSKAHIPAESYEALFVMILFAGHKWVDEHTPETRLTLQSDGILGEIVKLMEDKSTETRSSEVSDEVQHISNLLSIFSTDIREAKAKGATDGVVEPLLNTAFELRLRLRTKMLGILCPWGECAQSKITLDDNHREKSTEEYLQVANLSVNFLYENSNLCTSGLLDQYSESKERQLEKTRKKRECDVKEDIYEDEYGGLVKDARTPIKRAANKAAKDAKKAEKDAKKAERAAKKAEKDARKAERDAKKSEKGNTAKK